MAKRAETTWRAASLGLMASCLASASFAVGPESPSAAATAKSSECLSGPKGAAPQGERWYYRVERGTKKHCWYTRADSARNVAARAPQPEPRDAADETPAAPLQPSVANARAEATRSAFPAPPAVVAPPASTAASTSPDAQTQTVADRFSDYPNAGEPAQSLPQGATQPTPLTAAKPSSGNQDTSLWMVLVVIAGALALVGGAFALITRFARPRVSGRSDEHWSDARWDTHEPETSPPLAMADDADSTTSDGPPMNWVRVARERADRQGDEIEHLLSRPARPA